MLALNKCFTVTYFCQVWCLLLPSLTPNLNQFETLTPLGNILNYQTIGLSRLDKKKSLGWVIYQLQQIELSWPSWWSATDHSLVSCDEQLYQDEWQQQGNATGQEIVRQQKTLRSGNFPPMIWLLIFPSSCNTFLYKLV